MIEKSKEYLKKIFSNGPKAKIMLGIVIIISLTLVVASIRKTVVINVDGKEQTFVTYKGTIKDVLQESGIIINEKDKVQPALNEKLSENDRIIIKKAVEVELVTKDKTIKIKTAENTIDEMLRAEEVALKEKGIEFKEEVDEITPALDTKINKDLKIKLVKVEVVNEVATEEIDFDVITQEDENLDINVEKVVQDGAVGEKEITYEVIKKDGKEISRDIISSKVTKEPINKIVAEGTRRTFASRDGNLEYKDVVYCEATAYYGGGYTATGTVPVYNPSDISTIAVDPRVIPLGSLVYVEGYGKAIAADTGGAINGNIIDVYVDSYDTAVSWGRKYGLAVYILAYPGQW